MKKIIIAVHGMRNKPPRRLLSRWWKRSIHIGLASIGKPRLFFRFEMVYWAPWLYSNPLNAHAQNPRDPLFIHFPFAKTVPLKKKKSNRLRKKVLQRLEKISDFLLLKKDLTPNLMSFTELILRRFFNDLYVYNHGMLRDQKSTERPAKELIRQELVRVLRKHRKKRILLIGHSMGSIIAYDVLTLCATDIAIDTFVTMGSPLGLPAVLGKNLQEFKGRNLSRNAPSTPENVIHSWHNFSDLGDRVALNFDLSDDYQPNSRGIRAIDHIVDNTYKVGGKRNPHKSYGYLQTEEFAAVVDSFLRREQGWLSRLFDRLVRKIYFLINQQ